MKKMLLVSLISVLLFSCSQKERIDLLVYNATIYTVDSSFSTAEAMVLRGGKIIATGKSAELDNKYEAREKIDAHGKFIYPGFIDAHAHFVGYGSSLQRVNLVDTKSWDEVVERTKIFAKEHPSGWLLGRGWDQNDWPVKEFPDNKKLNELFPDRPVLLTRIDGHAAIANRKALEMAGVKPGDKILGGEIVTYSPLGGTAVDSKETRGEFLTGVLVDNAVGLVSSKIPDQSRDEFIKSLQDAEKNCFAVGLTTIDDCGLSFESVDKIRDMQDNGELKMRLYVMLSDDQHNFDYLEKKGIIKTDRLNVRSIKVYADGALGSRGACLLEPYSDKPGWRGFLLRTPAHYDSVASYIHQKGWQMCTHAIGDSGNREILKIYAKYLKGKNDLRWRIEHSQVINLNDFNLFGANSVIPSVQPTHATSDMYWAGDRLGPERVKSAYAFGQLLQQNGWMPLGTDFPVEDISPFKTFYAAVVRKDAKGWPEQGYQIENALTREQALRGMTIWAAKANFEEKEKGSLEKGKFADFIILDKDIMKAGEKELLEIKVLETYIGGERVYEKK
jgi:predicted amidohydrolase YtcJ